MTHPPAPLPLLRFGCLDSTQRFLGRHPELGCCGVLADHQTEGRGQGDNRWLTAPGAGLCFSARLPLPELAMGLMLQRAMAAVAEELRPVAPDLGLKWPNDLVAWVQGRLHKVGGIIGETRQGCMVLGLGVNLTQAPHLPERAIPPACLADVAISAIPDPPALARALLRRWQHLEQVRSPAFLWPQSETAICWEGGEGVCQGWEPDGRLRVRIGGKSVLMLTGDIASLGQA